MVTINQLVDLVSSIAGKSLIKKHVDGPQGVRGRKSDNRLFQERLHWSPSQPLRVGLECTYAWIEAQVHRNSVYDGPSRVMRPIVQKADADLEQASL